MEGARLVNWFIQRHQPKEILDLRARRGYFSLLAASYWANVDVVDDLVPSWEFPDFLKNHPNITFHNTTIKDFQFTKTYDFIIMKHIVIYYPKEYIFWELIPQIHASLNKWGMIFITYHLPHSHLMQKDTSLHQYSLDEFKAFWQFFNVKDFWDYINPVLGDINAKYHVEYVVLQKI